MFGAVEIQTLEIAVGAGLLLVGLGLGFFLGRRGQSGARLRTLENELRAERETGQSYRDSVVKHFDSTSDQFRDLTRLYAGLYAHLAEGARELCGESVPELGRGFGEPGLGIPNAVGESSTATDDSKIDSGAEAAGASAER
jgi:hypothetical protein